MPRKASRPPATASFVVSSSIAVLAAREVLRARLRALLVAQHGDALLRQAAGDVQERA
jgi:hypothetical protein